jgi:hypothetical protein
MRRKCPSVTKKRGVMAYLVGWYSGKGHDSPGLGRLYVFCMEGRVLWPQK